MCMSAEAYRRAVELSPNLLCPNQAAMCMSAEAYRRAVELSPNLLS